MAFTETKIPYSRHEYFQFFATGNGAINESLAPDSFRLGAAGAFEVLDIRIHFSTVPTSVLDLTARLSSIQGSAYNNLFMSIAVSTAADHFWQPSVPLIFQAGDHVKISLPLVSTIIWGLIVTGWSVT